MPKALLLENIHPVGVQLLERAGLEVETRNAALDEDELIDALAGSVLLGIRSKTQVTKKVLAASPDLLAIGAYCIGTNQIALQAASRQGVAVFNAPYSNTRSVVEMAVAEIIALTRRLTERDRSLHDGVWRKSATGSHEVRGRTLGIVGYGNIGSQLSVLAESLGMTVVFYDIEEKLALGNARRLESLDELLEVSDVVTVHVDGRAANTDLFGADEFAAMRPGAVFINLSRGHVVDIEALRDAVADGHLGGAAVDVFPTEPKATGDPFTAELRGLPTVILTPHVGGSTEEAQESIGRFVSGKLRDYLLTGASSMSVNLPGLSLDAGGGPGASKGDHRVAHIHRNTPGVLAAINQALAGRGVNIVGQVLGTRGDLGYVLTDVGSPADAEGLGYLAGLDETIRLRVLY
ncbi:MAG: phosphoglycerate dehydrogenase [Bifidobacteriaceae bacterium]|nr:phosphoglycerate dehydrogenase [Bifidobacteriaceae bacterium]